MADHEYVIITMHIVCVYAGANARDIVTARNGLASLRSVQGKQEQAESLLRESLAQAKDAFGYRYE